MGPARVRRSHRRNAEVCRGPATSARRSIRRRSTTNCRSSTSSAACSARSMPPTRLGRRRGRLGAPSGPRRRTCRPMSDDGLTWTFSIKPGVYYAPPFAGRRGHGDLAGLHPSDGGARPCSECPRSGGYNFYYSVIRRASTSSPRVRPTRSSGLESARRPHTLVVTTSAPTGDLPYRMAMPAAAPIPPHPTDPGARFGVAQGHDDRLRPVPDRPPVPYMFEGTRPARLHGSGRGSGDRFSGYDVGRSDRPGPQPFLRSGDR